MASLRIAVDCVLGHAAVVTSGGVAEVLTVRWIRGVLLNLDCGERARVDEGSVTAAMLHDDRVLRSGGVEIGALQRPRRLGVVVQKSDHPVARRRWLRPWRESPP